MKRLRSEVAEAVREAIKFHEEIIEKLEKLLTAGEPVDV